jgi:hypothetical protein
MKNSTSTLKQHQVSQATSQARAAYDCEESATEAYFLHSCTSTSQTPNLDEQPDPTLHEQPDPEAGRHTCSTAGSSKNSSDVSPVFQSYLYVQVAQVPEWSRTSMNPKSCV